MSRPPTSRVNRRHSDQPEAAAGRQEPAPCPPAFCRKYPELDTRYPPPLLRCVRRLSDSGLSEVNAGVVRKILIWLFVGFLIYFAARRPDAAAALIRFIAALLAGLAAGLSDMVSHVVT
jgi:hypothetical protein